MPPGLATHHLSAVDDLQLGALGEGLQRFDADAAPQPD